MKSINENLFDAIFDTSIELTSELTEISIDELINNEILREIPIVNSIISTVKIGAAIREKHFIKKILVFLQELRDQKISTEKLATFRNNFQDVKFRDRFLDAIIILNDRFLEIEKSKILAKLTTALINEKINEENFKCLCSLLDSIPSLGIRTLNKIVNDIKITKSEEAILLSSGVAYEEGYTETENKLSDFGNQFIEFGIK